MSLPVHVKSKLGPEAILSSDINLSLWQYETFFLSFLFFFFFFFFIFFIFFVVTGQGKTYMYCYRWDNVEKVGTLPLYPHAN
jgi:hypothetical protein